MANVLGGDGEGAELLYPSYRHVLARDPEVKVHLYGKAVRPGRKIGHVNISGDGLEDLREREVPLRHADELHGLSGGHRGLQRRGVGHAHVLRGGDDQPAGDEPRVLPRLHHARQVVQRGVDVEPDRAPAAQVVSLADAARAHTELKAAHPIGKFILIP